ncbi:2-oxo acid dehydrogenase subunit E2 [Halorubrum sp. AD140]|uniref:2-oxo acid dehydrogenase subunit E2 n=1 Tax=Halorubrum sp. AD140 TaxID=3050073 RepID=UPI002ACC813E|nr:2-oxo acid dehydrogenase subunit E2 [Halorubrum sp. AD140]MDZ5810756.1 2-oxo acid dehydrogenase subunit E2 [Halorubrum sp. AD140]
MGYVVRMPKLGLEMDRGTLIEWRIERGDPVVEGDTIADVESEKTSAEVDAREDGVLRTTYLEPGDSVEPGDPIGIVAASDEDISELTAELEAAEAPGPVAESSEAATSAAVGSDLAGSGGSGTTDAADSGGSAGGSGDRSSGTAAAADLKISPRARRRARELDVDPSAVDGSGPQGSITEADVERVAESDGSETAVRASPRARQRASELDVDLSAVDGTGPDGAITEADVEAAAEDGGAGEPSVHPPVREERELTGMRRTIAERLGESYREAVHVTEHRKVDAEELLAAVDAADAVLDVDVSIVDVLVGALSETLDEHPAFNATFEDDSHRIYDEQHVCLAVDVEEGLVAPALRDVGTSSLAEIATERQALTERALSGEYTMDDLQGGTFTVTNLGVLGVESFDPIINPPQIAILGVNALAERPVRGPDDDVAFRRYLPLDLSFDHRIVDGADAARFLGTLADHLTNPWPLLPESVRSAREGGGSGEYSSTGGSDDPVTLPQRGAVARTNGGVSGTVSAGSFEWSFDEPEDLGGSGMAPSPVDMLVGALSACLSASIGFQARKRDVSLEGVTVEVEGSPAEGPLGSIDVTVGLDSDADDETLDGVVTRGERTCYVERALGGDIDVSLRWERDE